MAKDERLVWPVSPIYVIDDRFLPDLLPIVLPRLRTIRTVQASTDQVFLVLTGSPLTTGHEAFLVTYVEIVGL